MKRNQRTITWVVIFSVVAVVVVVASLFLAPTLLALAPDETTDVSSIPTYTPDPCSESNLQALVPEFNRNARAFDDLSAIAQNTPREDLAPMISQLQEIRRLAEDYSVPPCMASAKEYQLAYMNTFIETLLVLYASINTQLTNKDVETINQGMGLAIQYHDQYMVETAHLLGIVLPPTPTLTPTATRWSIVPRPTP